MGDEMTSRQCVDKRVPRFIKSDTLTVDNRLFRHG